MLNCDDFVMRLKTLIENHGLTAATFAETIGVQRSSVSHIMSRRNKPSLDFILKINENFEEITLDWLIFGTDPKPRKERKVDPLPDSSKIQGSLFEKIEEQGIPEEQATSVKIKASSEIQQIIQLYKDGTFDIFLPRS